MGHDLDQVIRAAPGALATLRKQRDNLEKQIIALEEILAAHESLVLQYTVDEKGSVDDVTPLEPDIWEPAKVEDIAVKRTKKEQVLEVLVTIGAPMKAEDIVGFVDIDAQSIRTMLASLRKQGKIDRVERGMYQVVTQEVVNG